LEELAEALNQTPMIVGLGVAAAVLPAAFTLVERPSPSSRWYCSATPPSRSPAPLPGTPEPDAFTG